MPQIFEKSKSPSPETYVRPLRLRESSAGTCPPGSLPIRLSGRQLKGRLILLSASESGNGENRSRFWVSQNQFMAKKSLTCPASTSSIPTGVMNLMQIL